MPLARALARQGTLIDALGKTAEVFQLIAARFNARGTGRAKAPPEGPGEVPYSVTRHVRTSARNDRMCQYNDRPSSDYTPRTRAGD